MSVCYKEINKLLSAITAFSAGLSTIFLIATVSTNHILWCSELVMAGGETSTPNVKLNVTPSTKIYFSANFGLWRVCSHLTDARGSPISGNNVTCSTLANNVATGEKSDSEGPSGVHDKDKILTLITTNVKMKYVAGFILTGLFVETMGHVTFVIGLKLIKRKIFLFITGSVYVLAGLSLLSGIIIFVGHVTGETSHQSKVAADEIPNFRYKYGVSFVLLTASYCLTKLAGITAVYLFIIRHKAAYKKRHAELHELKSKAELLHDYLKKRKRCSVTPDNSISGSRRPSNHSGYQLANGSLSMRLPSLSGSDHLSAHYMPMRYYSRRRSRRRSSLIDQEMHDYQQGGDHVPSYCNGGGPNAEGSSLLPAPPPFSVVVEVHPNTPV